jgi:hypothetical protein
MIVLVNDVLGGIDEAVFYHISGISRSVNNLLIGHLS